MAVTFLLLVASWLAVHVAVEAKMCPSGCSCYSYSLNDNYVIKCDNTDLKNVPKDLSKFQNYKQSISLVLHENDIKQLSKSDFPPNVPIVALDVSKNRGLMIANDAFENIKNLRSLKLEDISFPFSSRMQFLKGMTKLHSLSLNSNYQFGEGRIPASLLSGLELSTLDDLQFHNCYLKGIDAGAFAGINLNGALDLGANQIDHIPEEVRKLSNVTKLDISQNSLKAIPDDSFLGMNNLKTLLLSNNYLNEMSISDGAFNGLQLTELIIEQSVLKTIPTAAIAPQNKLKVLKLNNSPIKTIPKDAFRGNYCLEELDLSNILVEIELIHLEGQADCIQKLHLNSLEIRDVPAFIKDFSVLDTLHLDGNYIKTIKSGDFVGTSISKVVFKMNPLSTIEPGAFAEFPRSISLDLSETDITNFTFVRDYPLGTIRDIFIGDFEPECDCDLALSAYQVLMIHGHCSVNATRSVKIESEEFNDVTTHCWPEGRAPSKQNVWSESNSASMVSSLTATHIILLTLSLLICGRFELSRLVC